MKNHQHINSDSGSDEYYTPVEIIEAARRVMGGIDLDPASSLTANQRVKAGNIFTQSDDGLNLPWTGRVWLNHPFGRTTNRPWISKLASEYQQGGGYWLPATSALPPPPSNGLRLCSPVRNAS